MTATGTERSCAPVRTREAPTFAVVIPTIGRPSLGTLLSALATSDGPAPASVVVSFDRPLGPRGAAPAPASDIIDGLAAAHPGLGLRVVVSPGRGPAAARNAGWRVALADWVVFLDDDVEPAPDWSARLADDLAAAGGDVVAVQGRLDVPLPSHRRPTDWERSTAGLVGARWITADLAYRRDVLARTGGFDERFRRAYREDADLGLRATALGRIVDGARRTTHPVRPAPWHVSVGRQAGNADDPLMRRLHGPGWRQRAAAPAGRRRAHVATTAAGGVALAAAAAGRPRVGALAATAWAGATARFAWQRIAPGPRTAAEVAAMAATSVAIPPAATAWWLRGLVRAAGVVDPGRPDGRCGWNGRRPAEAVLVDKDGTIVVDVAYNGDPAQVRPMAGAAGALDRLRRHGIPVAIVSNQSGIGRGLLTSDDVAAVNARTAELLGPFAAVLHCPHTAADSCECRKPRPGMVLEAARRLGVAPADCVVIGDIGSDVGAALAAGARAVLVPTIVTRPEEVASAPAVATTLDQAVAMVLSASV